MKRESLFDLNALDLNPKARQGLWRRLYRLLSLTILTLCLAIQVSPALAQGPDGGEVAEALVTDSQVRVIVALHAPAARGDMALQQHEVERAQEQVDQALSEEEFKVTQTFETLPGLVGEVTQEGLQALLSQPEVAAVALDLPVEATLAQSVSYIKANQVWSQLGFTGAGVNVAVLDTGIDANHPDLAGAVVAQHCFNQAGCPGTGEIEGNSALDENGHGTHVAGIIASRGASGGRGVAPGAGLVVVRVLGKSGNGYTSDVLAGLDWVLSHQAEYKVRAVNLSLGGGAYSGNCDTANATTQLYRQAVEAARAAGMVIFAASGNSGFSQQMMAPACVSGVVSVGSSFDTLIDVPVACTNGTAVEQVACHSNSSVDLDLLAPGTAVQAPVPGGGQGSKSGTSMATAHATGVVALLAQARPELTPAQIEQTLLETGVPVADARNGRITPRVDALAATLKVTGGNGEPILVSGTVLLQGRSDHSQTGIFLSQDACTSPLEGTPAAVTAADGSFQISLTQGQTYGCLRAVQAGYLVGQQATFKNDLGTLTLPGGDVTGDGLIDIFDLASVATSYGTAEAQADIDRSGRVDIMDLAIIASNYKLVGPATWPGE